MIYGGVNNAPAPTMCLRAQAEARAVQVVVVRSAARVSTLFNGGLLGEVSAFPIAI